MVNEVQDPIDVKFPEAADLHLRIAAGACRLVVTRGEGEQWATGKYTDPNGNTRVEVTQDGGTVRIHMHIETVSIPATGVRAPLLEIALGTARPYSLTIETGASESKLETGGLPLREMALLFGAGKADLAFSAPNPERMERLKIALGAGAVEVIGLGNANCAELVVEGGAMSCCLDFAGQMRAATNARISTAMASVELRVPVELAARLTSEGFASSVSASGPWVRQGTTYVTGAASAGAPVLLQIHNSSALGSLILH